MAYKRKGVRILFIQKRIWEEKTIAAVGPTKNIMEQRPCRCKIQHLEFEAVRSKRRDNQHGLRRATERSPDLEKKKLQQ